MCRQATCTDVDNPPAPTRDFAARGTPGAAFNPMQKLRYIGRRAMGALEFVPPLDVPRSAEMDDALDVAQLVQEARRVIEGDVDVTVPAMMLSGGSAGGARAIPDVTEWAVEPGAGV